MKSKRLVKEVLHFGAINITEFIDSKIKSYKLFCQTSWARNQSVNEEDIIGIDFWLGWKSKSKEEYHNSKLELVGLYTVGLARKKTWNVLRVALRKQMYEESELIALGHSTFVQNYKEPVPKGWDNISYPTENEIKTYKEGIKKNMVNLWGKTEEEAEQIIQNASKHF